MTHTIGRGEEQAMIAHQSIEETVLPQSNPPCPPDADRGPGADRDPGEERSEVAEAFLSLVSHELCTPLTALRADLQLAERKLDRGGPLEAVTASVTRAGEQATRLGERVTELLEVLEQVTERLEETEDAPTIEPLFETVSEIVAEHEEYPDGFLADLGERLCEDSDGTAA